MSGSNSKHDDLNPTCDYLKNIEDHSSIKIGDDSKQNLNQEDSVRNFYCPETEESKPTTKIEQNADHRYASYKGCIQSGRMESYGKFNFDNGAVYDGHFKDGEFHGKGTLSYPNGMRFSGHWKQGKVEKGFLQFKDGLPFDQNEDPLTGWRYLNPVWDRRFYPEICNGIKSSGSTMQTAHCHHDDGEPVHRIPTGCYDTLDGFFHPPSSNVYHYLKTKCGEVEQPEGRESEWKFLRYAVKEEADWIIRHCRKGTDEKVGYSKRGNSLDQEDFDGVARGCMLKQGTFRGQSMHLRDIAKSKMDPENKNSDIKL